MTPRVHSSSWVAVSIRVYLGHPPPLLSDRHYSSSPSEGGERRNLFLCLQRSANSVLLLRKAGLLKVFAICSFSVRHRSHCLFPFLYDGALAMMLHLILGVGLSFFSQTWVARVVLCLLSLFLNDSVCPYHLFLKFTVLPMYSLGSSLMTLAW